MWYEILPSAAIMIGALSVPTAFAFVLNKVVLGHGYRRDLSTPLQRRCYFRDSRVTGWPYTFKGLEGIPD